MGERKVEVVRKKEGDRKCRDVITQSSKVETVQYLTEEEKRKIDRIRKFTSTTVCIPEGSSDVYDIAGVAQITGEEAEDEETIKERLRTIGYLQH